MEKFGLIEKEYSTIPGVSLEPGSFNSFPCYRLHRDALVSQPTKWVTFYFVLIKLNEWADVGLDFGINNINKKKYMLVNLFKEDPMAL